MPHDTSANASTVAVTGQTLVGIELFQGLDAGARGAIAGLCHGHRYPPEQQIVSYKDDSHDVFFIVSGKVRATIYSATGKEITFRDQSAGQMFGDISAIDGEPRSATVVALEDSLVLSMTAEAFRQVLREHQQVAQATMRRLTALIRLLSDRVIEFSTLGVNNRIHAELLRLAREHADGDNTATIAPLPTHAEIAREKAGILKRGLGKIRGCACSSSPSSSSSPWLPRRSASPARNASGSPRSRSSPRSSGSAGLTSGRWRPCCGGPPRGCRRQR